MQEKRKPELEANYCIKNMTSFKIGGNIARMYFPESTEEFINIIKQEPNAFIAGNLSNVLISSDGYSGAVISTKKLQEIKFEGNKVTAGAGVRGTKLSKLALGNELSGMEFMIAFPGSVGGEVFMNAGAHGQTISDIFNSAKIYSPDEGLITLAKKDMNFSYRTSICQRKPYSILEAEFTLIPKSKEEIQLKIDENLNFRKNKQPSLTIANCGSVFKNPEGNFAGKLLESVNVKGLTSGGAKVWENHSNFIINDGNAASLDVLHLMFEMYKRVKEKYNIELKPEVRFLGGNNEEENEICRILYKK